MKNHEFAKMELRILTTGIDIFDHEFAKSRNSRLTSFEDKTLGFRLKFLKKTSRTYEISHASVTSNELLLSKTLFMPIVQLQSR